MNIHVGKINKRAVKEGGEEDGEGRKRLEEVKGEVDRGKDGREGMGGEGEGGS